MARFLRVFALALFFVAACAIIMPGLAHAQSSGGSTDYKQENQYYQTLFGQVGTAKIKAANGVMGLFGATDIKSRYCLQRIQQMFSTLGTLSDPLSLIWNAVSQQIMQLVNQVCQVALSAVNQLKQFTTSLMGKICIPLPNLGLGIGGLKLNLPLGGGSCNGIQLLKPGGNSNSGTALPAIDWRKLIPQSN